VGELTGAAPFLRVIAARLAQAVCVAVAVSALCFALLHLLPGDLALEVAAARYEDRLTPASIERVRSEAGLDRPILAQFASWVAAALTGDLGRSLVTRKPVAEELAYHLRYTAGLGAAGLILSYLIALPLGVAAGLRPGGWIDGATAALSAALASTPTFLIGLALISLFALQWRLLPPAGFGELRHMALPALTLALGLAAFSTRILRNAVAETWASFHMQFARLKGLKERRVALGHGLRNASIPVVAFMAVQMTLVIDGFVVIETLFNYPGVGDLLIKALLARDLPMAQGAGLVIGLAFAAVNLAADLACLWLDPRQRLIVRPQ
jgi:peptide/nickel transport system permease protein